MTTDERDLILIGALIDSDLDLFDATSYLHDILYGGFIGYAKYSTEELENELRERGIDVNELTGEIFQ